MTAKLKITAIKPYPVWVGIRNQMLVKVETDQGIFGWGESGLSGREQAVAGAIEHYREFLIGRDAMQIGRIWQEIYRSQYFEGGRVLQAAMSAIDIALHDIKGKALGVPVYELLGGRQRERIPTFASTGDEAEGAAAIERARELRAQGWQAIRFFPAGQDSKDIFEPRESIGPTASMLNEAREVWVMTSSSVSIITTAYRWRRRRASATSSAAVFLIFLKSRYAMKHRQPMNPCAE